MKLEELSNLLNREDLKVKTNTTTKTKGFIFLELTALPFISKSLKTILFL